MDYIPIGLALTGAITVMYLFKRKRLDLLGPRGWPFLGNVTQLDIKKPHETLTEWSKKYGDVYQIKLFGKEVVVVSSEAGIREILISKSEDFAGRPTTFRIAYFKHFAPDIVFTSMNLRWAHQKKVIMTGLRMVGEGVQRLENISMDIIEDLVKEMESYKSKPFDPRDMISESIASITGSLVFGGRLTQDELTELVALTQDVNETVVPGGAGVVLDVMPWLRFIPNAHFERMKKVRARLNTWINNQLSQTIEALQEGETLAALDDLLREHLKGKAEGKDVIKMDHISAICKDLLGAGVITTSFALHALLAILAEHLEIQVKAQTQIRCVIGDRHVKVKDRHNLPYVDSILHELLRFISHAPIGIPHQTMKDTSVQGYPIPKGTEVWPNLWAMHHDSALWDDPWEFKPERFLDVDGTVVPTDHPKRKRLLPFGAGRRVCAGETMARNRLFLFVVTLLQRFTFKPETDGATLPSDPRNFRMGVVIRADDYKIRAVPRSN